jgi:hypothetical protein
MTTLLKHLSCRNGNTNDLSDKALVLHEEFLCLKGTLSCCRIVEIISEFDKYNSNANKDVMMYCLINEHAGVFY